MRRLTAVARWTPGTDEDGIAVILVCVSLVTVLAMAALVVDVGALLQEKRQLQNGADAGALSVAHSCALGQAACASPAASALVLAGANANDAASNVDSATVDVAHHLVQVKTSTKSSSGGTLVPFNFAKAITGQSGETVHAKAVATWGPPQSLTTLPLTMSPCELAAAGFGVQTVVYFHGSAGAKSCPLGPAGKDVPGGFGWLTGTSNCSATITVGNKVTVDTGTSAPKACDVHALLGTTVLVPVFDSVTGTGANATYHVSGFAAFVVNGYRFPSSGTAGNPVPCKPPDTCIGGTFTKFVTTPGPIGGTDFGVSTVKLVS